MGSRRHGLGEGLGNVVKCICALAVTAKRSVYELFLHYLHNLSLASGIFAPIPSPTGALSLDPLRNFRPQTPNLPTPGQKSRVRP